MESCINFVTIFGNLENNATKKISFKVIGEVNWPREIK